MVTMSIAPELPTTQTHCLRKPPDQSRTYKSSKGIEHCYLLCNSLCILLPFKKLI